MAARKKPAGGESVTHVEVPELAHRTVYLRLVGKSPLVAHAWGTKALEMLRGTQQKKAKGKREAKNPEAEFHDARYLVDGKDSFPVKGIKGSFISACRFVSDLPMTIARGAFFVNLGENHAPIEGDAPVMREDPVRVGGKGPGTGTADLRYRPEYKSWSIPIRVDYNPNVISLPQLINLIRHAGFHVGIGEDRPERGGQWGMFDVQQDAGAGEQAAAE